MSSIMFDVCEVLICGSVYDCQIFQVFMDFVVFYDIYFYIYDWFSYIGVE